MKKTRRLASIFSILLFIGLLFGCVNTPNNDNLSVNSPIEQEQNDNYTKISAEDAKKIMDESEKYILLDVRTQEEFDEGHIESAILIPDFELEERASDELPDKTQAIFVYCRSGRRSANSAQLLYNLGYTNVYDLGGIIDWPYNIVS